MTHVPEIGAINRVFFSGAGFWYVCHAYMAPDLSGTRFRRRLEHCSILGYLLPIPFPFGVSISAPIINDSALMASPTKITGYAFVVRKGGS